jgi:hypothetical protein
MTKFTKLLSAAVMAAAIVAGLAGCPDLAGSGSDNKGGKAARPVASPPAGGGSKRHGD